MSIWAHKFERAHEWWLDSPAIIRIPIGVLVAPIAAMFIFFVMLAGVLLVTIDPGPAK